MKNIKYNPNLFKTPDNYHFQHRGKNYCAIFDQCIEEDAKGYISHNITLINTDEQIAVGYLKTFYLPNENLEHYYPNPLYFISTRSNCELTRSPKLIENNKGCPWEDKTVDQKITTLRKLLFYIDKKSYEAFIQDIQENKDTFDHHYLDKIYQAIANNLDKSDVIKSYQQFLSLHLDKPMPEKIFIADKGDTGLDELDFLQLPKLQEYADAESIDLHQLVRTHTSSQRKQGLGEVLYKLTADWLAMNKLNLYIGGTNDNSDYFWDNHFKNNPQFQLKGAGAGRHLNHQNSDLSYLFKKQPKPKNFKPSQSI